VRDTKTANQTQQAPSEKKTFKRRRCQNCNALYMPTREDQKFCRTLPDPDKCRKEFYRYGSSYGPLKTGLHKAIDKKYRELEAVVKAGWREAYARIDLLEKALFELKNDYEACFIVQNTPPRPRQIGQL
jgi:hypothetical protein